MTGDRLMDAAVAGLVAAVAFALALIVATLGAAISFVTFRGITGL